MSSRASDQRYAAGYPSTSLGQHKVAIPRLPKPGQANSAAKHRRRVPRACTGCRSHKIKCTGERPSCKHCTTTHRECVYIMPRKDRLKIVTERCQQMAGILRGLRTSGNDQEDARIANLLEAVEEDVSELRETRMLPNTDDAHGSQGSRELSVTDQDEDVDMEPLDSLDENLHEDEQVRATGFIGKSSEVQWLRAVALARNEQLEDGKDSMPGLWGGFVAPYYEQVSAFSYWTDGENIDMDVHVDPFELPRAETAERLLQCYMAKVHDSFPILPRKPFEDQFRVYFRALQNGNAPRLSPKWQAILNLVFAIGAKYSHLTKASWRADEHDHSVYHAKARAIGISASTITGHSDIPQIQSIGLLAFYWLTVGQVSRAWTMIGIAIRSAYSLGLHVRNEDPSASIAKRMTLIHTWWSLHSLERTLCTITGRPSIVVDSSCTVPLPVPVPEENVPIEVETAYRIPKGSMTNLGNLMSPTLSASSSCMDLSMGGGLGDANSGSYFVAVVQLSIITKSILESFYSAGTMIRSPAGLQHTTLQLLERLDQWIGSLPAEFNYQETHHASGDKFARERMLLGFQICSTRILLTRSCLTGRRHPRRDMDESGFARRMANVCVDAASTIIAMLPEESQPGQLYEQGPWWCIVHHLMQAMSVLMLALSYSSSTSHHNMALVYFVKKAVRWLQAMQDPVANRAYVVALNLLQGVARQHSIDISDLWTTNGQGTCQRQGMNAIQALPEPVQKPYLPMQFVHTAAHVATAPATSSYDAYVTLSAGLDPRFYSVPPAFNDNYYTVSS